MQFLTSLFGGEGNTVATMALALGIVLLLVVFGLWLLKVIFSASGTIGRGGKRRLGIVDSLPLDTKRQLVIIRRDNVEHLLMTGGPHDVVIETGIPVEAAPVRVPVRRPQAPATPPQKLPEPKLQPTSGRPAAAGVAPGKAAPTAPDRPSVALEKTANSLDRLRDGLRPVAERRSPSLRHTGLMRPVSRMESGVVAPFPENSPYASADSAKEGRSEPSGKGHGDGSKGGQRDEGRSADGT